tara:strand:- start:36092 stop:36868 length:777 start_codon:yes stop_codon:yes gene_type:complete
MINLILPIHTINKDIKSRFETYMESVSKQTVKDFTLTIVYKPTKELTKYLKDYTFESNVTLLENTGETDFCSQINYGAKNTTSEYVSITEVDDEITPTYIQNAVQHIKAYPNVSTFLPIVVDTNAHGEFLSFTNESVWAMNLTETIGFLDNESLSAYENYQTSGLIIKTSVYNEIGGLKSNVKLSFGYEFLLRLTHLSNEVFVIPKLTYRHTNFRKGSLFWDYKEGDNKLSSDEARFWLETAKKEQFFIEDREITYQD